MTAGEGLQNDSIVVGMKQTVKRVERNQVAEVYVAVDADSHVTSRIISLCMQKNIKLTYVQSMIELGKACGIQVGTAMAAVLKREK